MKFWSMIYLNQASLIIDRYYVVFVNKCFNADTFEILFISKVLF